MRARSAEGGKSSIDFVLSSSGGWVYVLVLGGVCGFNLQGSGKVERTGFI